jgi:hypothetical protein
VKAEILQIAHTRAALGKLTLVKYKGKDIDAKKIRRHVKQVVRQEMPFRVDLGGDDEKDVDLLGVLYGINM